MSFIIFGHLCKKPNVEKEDEKVDDSVRQEPIDD